MKLVQLRPRSWWQKWAPMWHRVPSAPPDLQRKKRIGKNLHIAGEYRSLPVIFHGLYGVSLKALINDNDFFVLFQTSTQRFPDGWRLLCGSFPGHHTDQSGLALCCYCSRQKETKCKLSFTSLKGSTFVKTIKPNGCSSNPHCIAVPLSPLLQRPCWSWSLYCTWASPLCPRSQLQMMMWTASHFASRFCQSAHHLWMTFSIRSAANPCHTCWLSDWRRRSCHRR